jgi:hypothetical protein
MTLFQSIVSRFRSHAAARAAIQKSVDQGKILGGRLFAAQIAGRSVGGIHNAEFKVFSQFGEDGILQYLIRETAIQDEERSFVEFGVENYTEANTRFLLLNDNWRVVVIDGSQNHVASIRASELYWRHDLTALASFITAENIDRLLTDAGFGGPIGILSVDIDGNDYWVWEKITSTHPVIVVVEYNSVFGADRAVTTPYDPAFNRARAHYSNLYWGASIKAFQVLAARKGYALVGSNSAGNNAFFVRRDRLGAIPELTPAQAHVESRFRDSRDPAGALTFLSGARRRTPMKDMTLVDVETGGRILVSDLP